MSDDKANAGHMRSTGWFGREVFVPDTHTGVNAITPEEVLPSSYEIVDSAVPSSASALTNLAVDLTPGIGFARGLYDVGAGAVNALAPGQSMSERAGALPDVLTGAQTLGFNMLGMGAIGMAMARGAKKGRPGVAAAIGRGLNAMLPDGAHQGLAKGLSVVNRSVNSNPFGRWAYGRGGENLFKGYNLFGRMGGYWHGWKPGELAATAKDWGKGVGNFAMGSAGIPAIGASIGLGMVGSQGALERKREELAAAFRRAGVYPDQAYAMADEEISKGFERQEEGATKVASYMYSATTPGRGVTLDSITSMIMYDQALSEAERRNMIYKMQMEAARAGGGNDLGRILSVLGSGFVAAMVARYMGMGMVAQLIAGAAGAYAGSRYFGKSAAAEMLFEPGMDRRRFDMLAAEKLYLPLDTFDRNAKPPDKNARRDMDRTQATGRTQKLPGLTDTSRQAIRLSKTNGMTATRTGGVRPAPTGARPGMPVIRSKADIPMALASLGLSGVAGYFGNRLIKGASPVADRAGGVYFTGNGGAMIDSILSPDERAACQMFGVEKSAAARRAGLEKAAADDGIIDTGIKGVVALSLVTGIPVGIAAHIIGNAATERSLKERELETKIKYYRTAAKELESRMAGGLG
jgi:hypothetical protein